MYSLFWFGKCLSTTKGVEIKNPFDVLKRVLKIYDLYTYHYNFA
ncbi:hypothetical protein FSS13T_17240 [Flavobacterium saliperosum S13]|uniref:Uncharacterized protein n=1 Tax=Flavobacterium saliperosum S13 TaxID=1341155 RepID=A0ABP2ZYV6_9FLAO|nr:hypothetical protein FSS13T_17240 [Flavobacterium saliperosum S13]